jgi:Holliday junction resolvasome RuvABC endonuclease subunit
MPNTRKTILGISPGTNTMGIALMKGNQLIDWRVKVFEKNWSPQKLDKIINVIHQIINKHNVSAIAIKVVHPNRSSDGLNQLISAIRSLSKNKKVTLFTCSIWDVKTHCLKDGKTNEGIIVEYVFQKHPELHREYQKEINSKNPYYVKGFEAIAIAHMFKGK